MSVDAGAETGYARLLSPTAAVRARRRRAALVVAAVIIAAGAAIAAIVVVRSLVSRHRPVVVNQQPGRPGVANPSLAAGAVVRAGQLFSDPVFVDPEHGFALARGTGGAASERLVTSRDGGANWRVAGQPFPIAGTFTTLLFTDRLTGYVFGPSGLLVTFDGGQQWEQPPITGEVERVIPAYGDVWAILVLCGGAPGAPLPCRVGLEISSDGGHHWRASPSPPPVAEGTIGGAVLGRVTGRKAYLLTWGTSHSGLVRTEDGGASWQQMADPCSSGWAVEDMAALGAGSMWLICGGTPSAIGEVKSVYRSEDGAGSWTLVASTGFAGGSAAPVGRIPFSGLVSQLGTVSPDRAWLGTGGVGVLETSDGGVTWSPVPGIRDPAGGTEVGVTFIRSPDGSVVDGWALGFGYAVWRTTDAVHWRQVSRT